MFRIFLVYLSILLVTSPAFGLGKIQNQDVKSEAELISAGATKTSLINTSKIYDTTLGDRLDTLISTGQIGGGGGSSDNVMPNFGAENGTTGWTASGGTFGTTASSVRTGTKAFTFTAAAQNQYVDSTLTACKGGLANDEINLWYFNGTSTTHTANVVNNSGVVIATVALQASATYRQAVMTFSCVSGETYKLRIIDTAASGWQTIQWDDGYQGRFVTYLTRQSSYIGSLIYPMNGSCDWALTSTSYSAFSAVSACTAPTVTGSVQAPATKIPGVVLSGGPGNYLFVVSGEFNNYQASANQSYAYYEMGDGTTFSGEGYTGSRVSDTNTGTVSTSVASMTFSMDFSTAFTNKQIEIYSKVSAGMNSRVRAANVPLKISVYYTPSIDQTVGRFGSDMAYGSVSIAANAAHAVSFTSASFVAGTDVDITSGDRTNTGIVVNPTVIGNLTASVTQLPVGSYRVCYDGTLYAFNTAVCQFAIQMDAVTPTTGGTCDAEGAVVDSIPQVCNTFNVTSVANHDFSLVGKRSSGTGSCTADLTSLGAVITIIPISQNLPQNQLVNNNFVASMAGSDGASITSGFTIVKGGTAKVANTALNVSTGVYTAPKPGFYEWGGNVLNGVAAITLGTYTQACCYYNGNPYGGCSYSYGFVGGGSAPSSNTVGSCSVYANTGDTLDIRMYSTQSGSTVSTSSVLTTTSFRKIGD